MITTNHRVRFAENNMIKDSSVLSFSSALSDFPFSNVYNEERSKVWKPSGCFEITDANNKLNFFDSAYRTVTIENGKYTSPSELASHIQTLMNTVSSGYTVTYETNFKFKFVRATNFLLRLSVATNSIFPTLGFSGIIDINGTSLEAESVSIHTSEWATFDFGFAASVDFIAMVGNVDEIFSLSPTARIKVYANNILDFTSPAFEKTLSRFDSGVFNFIDDDDSSFRYWKVEIIDKTNNLGPEGISISNLYLGDYQTLQSRNIENGFVQTFVDKSEKYETITGRTFYDKKPKYKTFDSCSLGYLEKSDRIMFETMFQKLGVTTPFYIAIDPKTNFSNDTSDLTKLVTFNSDPQIRHIIRDIFSISLSLKESV